MIHKDRIQSLNNLGIQSGDYVLYWMQQSQRAHCNHALEYAVEQSNHLNKKVVVVFGLTETYPDANLRHYQFMVEGLREVQQALAERGIKLVIRIGSPDSVVLSIARHAVMIVCDRGYLRHQKQWRQHVAQHATCRVVQVESDVVVPVEKASHKCEYAARFLRPKLNRLIDEYVDELPVVAPQRSSLDIRIPRETAIDSDNILKKLKVDNSVRPVTFTLKGAHGKRFGGLINF